MQCINQDHKLRQVMSPASVTRSNDQTANAYTAMANIEPRATAKQGGKGGESENGFGQCPSSLSRTEEPYTSPQTANDRINLTITKVQPSPLQKKEHTSPKLSDRKDLGSLFHKKRAQTTTPPVERRQVLVKQFQAITLSAKEIEHRSTTTSTQNRSANRPKNVRQTRNAG